MAMRKGRGRRCQGRRPRQAAGRVEDERAGCHRRASGERRALVRLRVGARPAGGIDLVVRSPRAWWSVVALLLGCVSDIHNTSACRGMLQPL